MQPIYLEDKPFPRYEIFPIDNNKVKVYYFPIDQIDIILIGCFDSKKEALEYIESKHGKIPKRYEHIKRFLKMDV